MAYNDYESDWADRVPERRWNGPYRDYGWESGQSGLPEFRDPSVHLTPEEWRQISPEERRYRRMLMERRRAGRGFYDRERPQRGRYSNQNRGYFGEPYGEEYSPRGYYVDAYGRGFNDEGYFLEYEEWLSPGPYTGYGPEGYQRSDERIRDEVCERLTRHGMLDARDIEVEVDEGEVTLKGTVEDRRSKRMAEDTAESVSGVWDVHNRLQINEERKSEWIRGGRGRQDRVGGSGVYPASGPMPEGKAEVQDMASWGQGERGAEGYYDHGESELHVSKPEEDEEK